MKDDNSGQMIDCNSWNCRRWSLISQPGRQSPPVGFLGRCLHDCVVDIVTSVLTIANHQGRFKEVIKVTLWTKRQQTEVSFLVSNSKEFCDCYFCDHPLREKCEWEEKRCGHFEEGKSDKKMEKLLRTSTIVFFLLLSMLLSLSLVEAYCPPGCRFEQCLFWFST